MSVVPTVNANSSSFNPASTGLVFSDVHIHLVNNNDGSLGADVSSSLFFPGRIYCPVDLTAWLSDLAQACLRPSTDNCDFLVTHGGRFFRGKRENRAVDGVWLQLRMLPDVAPELETLPCRLPSAHEELLLSPTLSGGGLIIMSGGPGSGKTTLASAVVVSRLKVHGGMAYTIEDPPEQPLNGPHGNGWCRQTSVYPEDKGGWAESLKGVLRSQPVATNLVLFVGEIRDRDAAIAMLRAASNGFLVICTAFANDVTTGLEALIQLVGSENVLLLSQVLRIFSYQKLKNDQLTAEMLLVDRRVSQILRNGMFSHLNNELTSQRNAIIAASRTATSSVVARPV